MFKVCSEVNDQPVNPGFADDPPSKSTTPEETKTDQRPTINHLEDR
jgi:hypothetical protein